MPDLDIVGGAAVDVVPVIPQFHTKLKALVLPIADRVGEEAGRRMGQAISDSIVVAIPSAIQRGGRAGVAAASRQGDDAGGAFSRSLRRKLEAAFKAMPKLDIRLSDTGVDAELARLRAKLEQLAGKRIGIDVDAMAARTEVQRIEAELERLGAAHPNIQVRADTATARAALAEIRAEIDAVDAADPDVKVHVDTSGATSALLGLAIQMGLTAAIPLGPVIAAGLGAVVSMAAAAGAGIGAMALVAIPAVSGVVKVVQAQTAAQDDAAKATDNGAKVAVQAAQRALQLAGAQASLASAHRSAARSIASANRSVEDAEKALADAGIRSADQRRQAAETIERAERSLADAQRTARQAEQDLTDARRDAAQQLAALNDKLTDGALDQREATLRVAQAQADLNSAMADPKATTLQREAAQLAYDRAVQAAQEQAQTYAELKRSADEQRRAGVDGSEAVKSAQERLADAQRDVADNARAVADAQRASARAQVDAAGTVADAQRRLADAVTNASETQVSAAESVASAERSLQAARLSGIDTTVKAISKTDEYRKALADLTPPQRDLFDAIAGPRGLKSAFKEWQESLQPEVLPLFTRGVDGAKASLPGLTPLALGAADGISTLMDKASAELKTPFWQSFKADLKENVGPAVEGFGVAFGNVVKGVAGIIDAFLPHMDGIVDRSDRITDRFAKWGTSLKGSPDFEKFLAYVKDTSPGLADFIGDLLSVTLDLTKSLAPMSTLAMEIVGPLISGIGWIAVNAPEAVQALWLLYAATRAVTIATALYNGTMLAYRAGMVLSILLTQGWTAALWQANLAFEANPIVAVVTIIVVAIAAMVAAVLYAYKHWDWFRTAVDATASAIKTAAIWIWDQGLKPAFAGIWTAIQAVGTAAMWLWDVAIGPAFRFIWAATKLLFTVLVVAFLLPAYLGFKQLGTIGLWLWNAALRPAFGWIGDKAIWLYGKAVKPFITGSVDGFKMVGQWGKWLWEHGIRPSFQDIGDKATWLWKNALKPAFDWMKRGIKSVADSFKDANGFIKTAWNEIKDITRGPVEFIIRHVYNGGIVPLWNKVAKITGVDPLKPMDLKGFHTGGIMSGYSPGRDDRVIAVGGGEAIMRPEWTRAIGADRINAWNAAARSGGVGAVQQAISDGMPAFQDGGIVGWVKDKAGDVGDFVSGAADYLDPAKLFDKAAKLVTGDMRSLLTNPWAKAVAKMPISMLSSLKDKALDFFGFGGGGVHGQWTKPVNAAYGTRFGVAGSMWSSGHHTGLDFPAAIGTAVKAVADGKVSMAQGGGPYGNHIMINHGSGLTSLYAHLSRILTSVGASVKQGQTIGQVGATGNVTGPHLHLEARKNGRAVDPMSYLSGGSSGTSAVAQGAAQAYAKSQLAAYGWGADQFGPLKALWQGESGWNHLAENPSSGAYGIPQALPGSKMASAGSDWRSNFKTQIDWGMRYIKDRPDYGSPYAAYEKWQARSPHWYDDGGYLPEGLSLVANGTGRPEPVFTGSQWDTLRATAGRGGAPTALTADVHVYVGDREITDIVRTEIDIHDAALASDITTGRWT